jgi:acetyl esterase/lipase
VLTHAQEWNIDPRKIIFQGGSAGGHLALISGYLQNNRIYDNECVQYTGDIKVMAVIDKYGAADLITFTPVYSGMVAWLGSRSTDETFIKSLSPIHQITSQTPPTIIIHGDDDPTIPYSQSVTLQAALQSAGVKNSFTTVPGGLHGGFPTAYNTQFETDVLRFLDEVLASIPTGTISTNSHINKNIRISNNTITINSQENIKTTVYNALGKEIYSTNLKIFDISEKGFYILKMENNKLTSIAKILIH